MSRHPWSDEDKRNWFNDQKIRRSYLDEVVNRIRELESAFNVSQYGELSLNPKNYPVFLVQSKCFDANKKTILIEEDSGKIMTFRRDKKIRFAEGNTFIKETDIDLESLVTVYATEGNDLKLVAAGVLVDPGQGRKTPRRR